MTAPVEIAWHNLDRSAAAEARVRERARRLSQYFDRITHIAVKIERENRRHRKGNLFRVQLDVGVPGGALAVSQSPGDDHAHTDLLVTVRDAFNAMERQLKRWREQHSGRPEIHAAPLQGRISEMAADGQSGQIQTVDGRLVYFHANSVVGGEAVTLSVGDPVELVIDPGEDAAGAHASTVRPISPEAFVDRPD